jgi:hypothetical protein
MLETHSLYRDYALSCRPMVLDDGSFQARVAIICVSGDKTKSQRFLDLEVFAVEEEAIKRARSAGMEWVDAHAKRDESSFSLFRGPVVNRPQN